MPLPTVLPQRRAPFIRASRAAFTLIELLAVMVIILLLAGLILNIAGNAQYKSAFARATAEIKQMETAMESYKVDNGTYPQGPSNGSTATPPAQTSTDALNAQNDVDPGSTTSSAKYIAASSFLFQQLSGNSQYTTGSANSATGVLSKAYITFLPSQLMNNDGSPVSAGVNSSTYIVDPFGFSYGYSTANAYAVANGTTTTTAGYNPTFDLWSTAGYATGGKSYPTPPAGYTAPTGFGGSAQQAYDATLWAKNW